MCESKGATGYGDEGSSDGGGRRKGGDGGGIGGGGGGGRGGGIGGGEGCGGDGGGHEHKPRSKELAGAAELGSASPVRVPGASEGRVNSEATPHATPGSTRAPMGAISGKQLSELAAAPQKARKSTTRREKQQACARTRASRCHGARGSRSTREQPAESIPRHTWATLPASCLNALECMPARQRLGGL